MSWTDERVEKLKQLWSEGLSASQIANQLGGVSRNAVIGKVHRLSLPGRAKSGGAAANASTRATARNTAPPRAPNFAARATNRRPAAPQSTPRTAGATALKQEVETAVIVAPRSQSSPDNVVVPIMKKVRLPSLPR